MGKCFLLRVKTIMLKILKKCYVISITTNLPVIYHCSSFLPFEPQWNCPRRNEACSVFLAPGSQLLEGHWACICLGEFGGAIFPSACLLCKFPLWRYCHITLWWKAHMVIKYDTELCTCCEHSVSPYFLCSFAVAAIATYHKLSGLEHHKLIVLHFCRLRSPTWVSLD